MASPATDYCILRLVMGGGAMVAQLTLDQKVAGSNPARPATFYAWRAVRKGGSRRSQGQRRTRGVQENLAPVPWTPPAGSCYTGGMTTHAQRTSGHRPSRLVIAVRTWTLLIFMLLSDVGSFLAGWMVADTHYGETGLWVGLAVGVVVAVGTILGVRRSSTRPRSAKEAYSPSSGPWA